MCTYIHAYAHTHTFIDACIHIYTITCALTYTYICAHMYTRTCIGLHMRTYIHTYKHFWSVGWLVGCLFVRYLQLLSDLGPLVIIHMNVCVVITVEVRRTLLAVKRFRIYWKTIITVAVTSC
jgi:hypothetical protein